jgi:hypothetical protein
VYGVLASREGDFSANLAFWTLGILTLKIVVQPILMYYKMRFSYCKLTLGIIFIILFFCFLGVGLCTCIFSKFRHVSLFFILTFIAVSVFDVFWFVRRGMKEVRRTNFLEIGWSYLFSLICVALLVFNLVSLIFCVNEDVNRTRDRGLEVGCFIMIILVILGQMIIWIDHDVTIDFRLLIRLFVWVILFSYLGFGISVSEFSESSRPSIICFNILLGFSFAMNIMWLFLTMNNDCIRIPTAGPLGDLSRSYAYNLLCFVVGLLTLVFLIVCTGADYAVNGKNDCAFAAVSMLIISLALNIVLWDLDNDGLIKMENLCLVVGFLEIIFIILGSITAVDFDESSNLTTAFVIFFITRTVLNLVWFFVVIPQGSCRRKKTGKTEWIVDQIATTSGYRIVLVIIALVVIIVTSIFTHNVSEEFWKNCQGKEPGQLLGFSIACNLVACACLLVEVGMDLFDKESGWALTAMGFFCTLLYGILAWVAAVKYGSVRGDYNVEGYTDCPPLKCLHEPSMRSKVLSDDWSWSECSEVDDYFRLRTSGMRIAILVISLAFVIYIMPWWMWAFKKAGMINSL